MVRLEENLTKFFRNLITVELTEDITKKFFYVV